MDRNPSARENGDKTAPNYIPNRATMRKVSARVRLEWATVNRLDRAGDDRVSQVVDKDKEQHREWTRKSIG